MIEFVLPVVFFALLWIWIQLLMDEAILVPLPRKTIREMLRLARTRKGEAVYDLGSGDGRVVAIAQREFGAKAIGIEKNPLLVWLSRNKGKIIQGDIFNANISKADVVIIYLSHKITQQLKGKFQRELKKGARIVSASHPIEGWRETKRIKTGHFYSYLYRR